MVTTFGSVVRRYHEFAAAIADIFRAIHEHKQRKGERELLLQPARVFAKKVDG